MDSRMSPTLERRMERRDERGDYHAEPSKAIRAQWHSNMFLLSCLCQGELHTRGVYRRVNGIEN